MKFTILTIFPSSFSYFNESILKKAQSKWLIEIEIVDIRLFSKNKHKKIDDIVYWWWQWMLLACQPIFDAIKKIKETSKYKKIYVVFVTPWWELFDQKMALKLSKQNTTEFIIICWRYEWIDQRIIDNLVDLELSVWNYVLSWWELPAMIIIDAISRLIPWVIWNKESHEEETFSDKLFWKKEFPQYTKPRNFMWLKVPEILVSWDHKKIAEWKRQNLK